jgi:hypothetical protein
MAVIPAETWPKRMHSNSGRIVDFGNHVCQLDYTKLC